MFDKEASFNELKRYYNKLKFTCSKQNAIFSLGNNVLVSRKKINDIICCIEASYPQEYKNFIESSYVDLTKIQSYNIHKKLTLIFAKKFFLADYCYVNCNDVDYAINSILKTLNSDFNIIENRIGGTIQ